MASRREDIRCTPEFNGEEGSHFSCACTIRPNSYDAIMSSFSVDLNWYDCGRQFGVNEILNILCEDPGYFKHLLLSISSVLERVNIFRLFNCSPHQEDRKIIDRSYYTRSIYQTYCWLYYRDSARAWSHATSAGLVSFQRRKRVI